MILLIFGPPGSGKGTQASLLSEELGIRAVSTGELLREAAGSETPIGRELRELLAAGQYAGDDIVNRIVAEHVDRLNGAGLILDGYPRTVEQAEFLDTALAERGYPKPVVVHLEVPEAVIINRLTHRAQCGQCHKIYDHVNGNCQTCGGTLVRRADDEPSVVIRRLATYYGKTAPVIGHYKNGRIVQVNGDQTPDRVFQEIRSAISPNWVKPPTPKRS